MLLSGYLELKLLIYYTIENWKMSYVEDFMNSNMAQYHSKKLELMQMLPKELWQRIRMLIISMA